MDYLAQNFTNIEVRRLLIQETGTYNQMFNRPYATHMSGESLDIAAGRMESVLKTGGDITGGMLAGVTGTMVQPSATPGYEIQIPNRFEERRIRFVLELVVKINIGADMVYYFQGYTDHVGINSFTNSIDPKMNFYINSISSIRRCTTMGPTGPVTSDFISESFQVVDNRLQSQKNFMMRPMDVFTGVQSTYMNKSYGFEKSSIEDLRLTEEVAGSVSSKRANAIAPTYLAKIADSYIVGTKMNSVGYEMRDIFGHSKEATYENNLHENPFIRALGTITGMPGRTWFNMDILTKLDPTAPAKTIFNSVGQGIHQLHRAGQTEYWHGGNRETIAATSLANAVPALMMECMISAIAFKSTNHDLSGRPQTTIIDVKTITSNVLVDQYEIFKRRLESEIIFDMTYGNQESYMLTIVADLFGDTTITISMNSGPEYTFACPSFCDGLFAPIVTNSKDHFLGVVGDFETLMNYIRPMSVYADGGMIQSTRSNNI